MKDEITSVQVVIEAKRKTTEECIALLDPEVHEQIRDSLKKYESKGVLIFENVDLSSRLIGEKFAIGYGPNNTLKEVPSDGKCQVQPPRGYAWQYYLAAYSEDANNGNQE